MDIKKFEAVVEEYSRRERMKRRTNRGQLVLKGVTGSPREIKAYAKRNGYSSVVVC